MVIFSWRSFSTVQIKGTENVYAFLPKREFLQRVNKMLSLKNYNEKCEAQEWLRYTIFLSKKEFLWDNFLLDKKEFEMNNFSPKQKEVFHGKITRVFFLRRGSFSTSGTIRRNTSMLKKIVWFYLGENVYGQVVLLRNDIEPKGEMILYIETSWILCS